MSWDTIELVKNPSGNLGLSWGSNCVPTVKDVGQPTREDCRFLNHQFGGNAVVIGVESIYGKETMLVFVPEKDEVWAYGPEAEEPADYWVLDGEEEWLSDFSEKIQRLRELFEGGTPTYQQLGEVIFG